MRSTQNRYKVVSTLMAATAMCVVVSMQACVSSESSNSNHEVVLADCPQADASLRSPTTFQGVTDLINALPKPLTVNCFLYNYDHPLGIFAVDNVFSAQPSAGEDNPRIFIIQDDFTVSMVPAGQAKDHVEFSKIINNDQSVKGDLEFPIESALEDDDIYTSILDQTHSGTICEGCHRDEGLYAGRAYISNIIAPAERQRITKEDLAGELENCRPESSDRCAMLNYIYATDEVTEVTWPF